MEILGLKKADAESIYSVLIHWLKTNNVQFNKVVQQMWLDLQKTIPIGTRNEIQFIADY